MLGKGESILFRKIKGILVGVLCVAVVSGCGTKVSDVALVSDIGTHCRS